MKDRPFKDTSLRPAGILRTLPAELLILILCFAGCTGGGEGTLKALRRPGAAFASTGEDVPVSIGDSPPPENEAVPKDEAEKARFRAYREQAAGIALSLDERLLAAQVLMTGLDGNIRLNEPMATLLRGIPAGGVMLFKYNLNGEKVQARSLLAECSSLIAASGREGEGIPPFMAVDHEGGSVHRFGPDVERLPPPASFWDMAQVRGWDYALKMVEESALRSAGEMRDLGITMNFAPVAEVLGPGNASFLEDRSYGPDADFVEAAGAAFIRGMEAGGIACAVKHFPGNTRTDPHRGKAVLDAGLPALDEMTRPFRALIRTLDLPALMVSHVVVKARDGERNASLSPVIIGTWLREELGFTGIVLADDFSMAAVAADGLDPGEAAVEALNAGVDMVMTWPADIRSVHQAILSGLRERRLSGDRLREAAARIIFEKIRRGLIDRSGRE
jgi:beta-N-acetylhexosaminidase